MNGNWSVTVRRLERLASRVRISGLRWKVWDSFFLELVSATSQLKRNGTVLVDDRTVESL